MTALEQICEDGKYFRAQLGEDKGFLVTFSLCDENSAEHGEFKEIGYKDYDSCEPDSFDKADGLTAVSIAVRYLQDKGVIEASSSHFHVGLSYSDQAQTDYRTGEEETLTYHPENFTEEEERAIFKAIFPRRS